MTVGRVAANCARSSDKRDGSKGKVEEAHIFIGLTFAPIYMQGMGVRNFLALGEQVTAQCDAILGAQREVLVDQSVLGWNINLWADSRLTGAVRNLGKKGRRTCTRTWRESGRVYEVVLTVV